MALEQYPSLTPITGLVFEAYMSRKDIGSGIRVFVVYKVGRKYVSLFYGPQLIRIQLTWGEWKKLYMQPIEEFNALSFKQRIKAKLEQAARFNMQFNADMVKRICSLKLTNGLELFANARRANVPRVPVTNVKRGTI